MVWGVQAAQAEGVRSAGVQILASCHCCSSGQISISQTSTRERSPSLPPLSLFLSPSLPHLSVFRPPSLPPLLLARSFSLPLHLLSLSFSLPVLPLSWVLYIFI